MKIEMYGVEKMSLTGSHLHSMIQNRNTPIVDLLVRESLQNSLDAKDDDNPSKFVTVEFKTGTFDTKGLDNELEGIDLSARPGWGDSFLSMSDKNTVGLTGEYNDKTKNLYKLVFGIMEGQQASGAGGSWGIGKTVYFQVGVGLVIYYSRTKTADGGYADLLTAALIEDENRNDALLPSVGGHKYGIAWWGSETSPGSGTVKECQDRDTIDRVLGCFGIQPYEGRTTGTVIIIPYINEAHLLSHNLPERISGAPVLPWLTGVDRFIKLSVQKWYSSRLNNSKYKLGKYLNVVINGRPLGPDAMEPFFKLTRALYNRAALANVESSEADAITFEGKTINCFEVSVNSYIKPNVAGHVAYAVVNRAQLGMTFPDNRPSPNEYIYSEKDEENPGKPFLLFCRKPGMVVDYVMDGEWLRGVAPTSEDQFLVAYFVLNSTPVLQVDGDPLTLEDYVRKTEMADHFTWDDINVSGFKLPIITRIKQNVSRKLKAAFEVPEEDVEKFSDSGLGNLLGNVLLPPEGFGRRPSTPKVKDPSKVTTVMHKNIRYSYHIEGFNKDGMVLKVKASTGNKTVSSFGFSLEMDSTSGPVNVPKWEKEIGIDIPFAINSVSLSNKTKDGTGNVSGVSLSKDGKTALESMTYEPATSKSGDWYGLVIRFADGETHAVDAELEVNVAIRRKDIKPSLLFVF